MTRRSRRNRLLPQPLNITSAIRLQARNPQGLTPTADTWVSRSVDQRMVAVKVADMEPTHLFRWVRYFRNKYRASNLGATDDQLDALIMKLHVTAPAIYARAVRLGLIPRPGGEASDMLPTEPRATVTFEADEKKVVPLAGRRKMTFDDEDV